MRNKILEMLISANDFVSGEYMSKELGVSRAAVWKHVRDIKKEGHCIECVSGLGYKFIGFSDILDPALISFGLKTKIIGKSVEIHEKIDSTNLRAKKLALEGAEEGMIVLSEEQTAGRGRMERKWHSPAGKGIWMSIILRPQIPTTKAPELTLLTSIAIHRAIYEQFELKTQIKWPNDILHNGKKICGILSEIQAEPDIINSIIIGIGVNVNLSQDDFNENDLSKATSIALVLGKSVSRTGLLKSLLCHLDNTYCDYLKATDLEKYLDYYRANSATIGRKIIVSQKELSFECEAIDICKDGSLLAKLEDGSLIKLLSGDISLRSEMREQNV